MKSLLLLLSLFFSLSLWAQIPEKLSTEAFTIGETVTIQSKILQEKRTLNIYLPPGYHPDSAANYSVIYLLDGSADEDFIHIAGLVQFANYPWVNTLPPSIVIGIANVDRKRDFTYPTVDEQAKKAYPTVGGSAAFIDFLEKELQPFVKANYPTENHEILIGQSLGGLVASEIFLKKTNLFSHYLIVSPSLWWSEESLLQHPMPSQLEQKVTAVVIVGKEGEIMERVARELYEKLQGDQTGKVTSFYQFLAGQDHANILHLAVYQGFEVLFGKKEEE